MIGAEKSFLFNAALDVAYMTAGFWLIDASNYRADDADRFRGFGQSLILQGGFLFVFDLIMHKQIVNQRKNLEKNTKVEFYPVGGGLGVRIGF